MSTCVQCGGLTEMRAAKVCRGCMKKWTEENKTAYDIVVAELGPDSYENHEAFVARLKQVKRERTKEKK